jgi:hypothetical protein
MRWDKAEAGDEEHGLAEVANMAAEVVVDMEVTVVEFAITPPSQDPTVLS